jgi:hypothetical protein
LQLERPRPFRARPWQELAEDQRKRPSQAPRKPAPTQGPGLLAEAHRLEKPQGQRSKRLGPEQAQIQAQAQVQVQVQTLAMSLQALRSSPQAAAKASRLVLQG